MDNIRNTIARETTAHKLSLLRSQKKLLQRELGHFAKGAALHNLSVSDLKDILEKKAKALETLPLADIHHAQTLAKDVQTFLKHEVVLGNQAPRDLVLDWHARVDGEIEFLTNRTNYAVIFTDVLQQWLEQEGRVKPGLTSESANVVSEEAKGTQSGDKSRQMVELAKKEPFSPKAFLEQAGMHPKLMEKIAKFSKELEDDKQLSLKNGTSSITPGEVRDAMSVLAADVRVYSADVRRQIAEERSKNMVVDELCSALSATWNNLADWHWPESGIEQVLQTHLNGKQRLFLKVDIVTAIFLQLVANRWKTWMLDKLEAIRADPLWTNHVAVEGLLSRDGDDTLVQKIAGQIEIVVAASRSTDCDIMFNKVNPQGIVKTGRQSVKDKFAALLQDNADDYDDSSTAISDNGWTSIFEASKVAKAYDGVYRKITADIFITQMVDPTAGLVVLHGDIENFGNSVSHDVILAVLEFFGLSSGWLKWMKTYLEVPISDDKRGTREAGRGTPFGLGLSTLVQELLLIILDFAVAAETGMWINRNHDDYWLWSIDDSQYRVDKAWKVMKEFTSAVGLSWNMSKTGCTVVQGPKQTLKRKREYDLPPNELQWGLFILKSDGKWAINEKEFEQQTVKAWGEWETVSSLLAKINVLNKYNAFLARNFGTPLAMTGRQHYEMVQDAFNRFNSRITGHARLTDGIREAFESSFPEHQDADLPDGMFIWPIESGGFALHAHSIRTLSLLKHFERDEPYDWAMTETKESYAKALEIWQHPATCRQIRALAKRYRDGAENSKAGRYASEFFGSMSLEVDFDLPAFVSEKDFIIYHALYAQPWLSLQNMIKEEITVASTEYARTARALYAEEIQSRIGSQVGDAIVPAGLVPKYAVQDLKSMTKQLFSSGSA